jgi:hypothetical protein
MGFFGTKKLATAGRFPALLSKQCIVPRYEYRLAGRGNPAMTVLRRPARNPGVYLQVTVYTSANCPTVP